MISDVTQSRYIKQTVKLMLWGKAAGRCQFAGCNKPLWKSSVTKEQVNIAQNAHIWAFSSQGPRGNEEVDAELLNSFENLMLVCHECHRLIDQDDQGTKYSVDLLQAMKTQHEKRIEIVTSVTPDKQSSILLYGANIGEQSSPLTYSKAANALFPDRFPSESIPITFGLKRSPFQEEMEDYWSTEKSVLENQFEKIIRPQLTNGDIEHLSIFGIAPQPLLIRLGTLLSDIPAADIYQLHREPVTWSWNPNSAPLDFKVHEPNEIFRKVAINFSISAPIDPARIHAVLDKDISIWTVTIDNPNNDCIQSREDLSRFRKLMRQLFDRIKLIHGENCDLHIFPAVPVSVAIEIGRVRMPKINLNLILYDEVKSCGGFIHAFDI